MSESIEQFMTKRVETIAVDATLRDAHALMRLHAIHHLPVLHHGRLVGLVSEGDLHLVETLKDVDQSEVQVAEAMRQELLTFDPAARTSEVARQMAEHNVGSAIIVRDAQVLGIFTSADALRALGALLEQPSPEFTMAISVYSNERLDRYPAPLGDAP